MFKVMDTYRKGVEYYNSYGLKADKNPKENAKGNKKQFTGKGSFWDLN